MQKARAALATHPESTADTTAQVRQISKRSSQFGMVMSLDLYQSTWNPNPQALGFWTEPSDRLQDIIAQTQTICSAAWRQPDTGIQAGHGSMAQAPMEEASGSNRWVEGGEGGCMPLTKSPACTNLHLVVVVNRRDYHSARSGGLPKLQHRMTCADLQAASCCAVCCWVLGEVNAPLLEATWCNDSIVIGHCYGHMRRVAMQNTCGERWHFNGYRLCAYVSVSSDQLLSFLLIR